MIKLYYRTLDPLSRAMKISLGEKRAAFQTIEVPTFGNDSELMNIDAKMRTPILIDDMWDNGTIIPDAFVAFEYLEDIAPSPHLFPSSPSERAKVRTFCFEAASEFVPLYRQLIEEKAHKILNRAGSPDTNIYRKLRDGALSLLKEAEIRAAQNGYMVGNKLTLADIIIWSQLSLLDYFDLISWDNNQIGKQYYRGLKQRPAFRPILNDAVIGLETPPHYKNLDF